MRFLITIFVTCSLFANQPSTPEELSSLQGEPSALIAGCVNAITGDFVFRQTDLAVKGAEPLEITRHYISREVDSPALKWQPMPHLFAFKKQVASIFEYLLIPERNGIFLAYQLVSYGEDGSSTFAPLPTSFEKGIINQAGYSPLNNTVKLQDTSLTVNQQNGHTRCYRFTENGYFILEEEILPNENHIFYSFDSNSIVVMNPTCTKTYASINWEESSKKVKFSTSDKQVLVHSMKKDSEKNPHIKEIRSPHFPREKLYRNKKGLVIKRAFPNGREIELEYDKKNRVVKIIQPCGNITKIEYHKTHTIATHCDHTETRYQFDPQTLRLDFINTYPLWLSSERDCYRWETFTWTEDGYLQEKQVKSRQGTPLLTTTFEYDKRGNLTKKTLTGRISSATSSPESYSTEYTHDQHSRLTETREDNGQITTYTYLGKTTLPTSITSSRNDRILNRIRYLYDEDNLLIEEITDDGDSYTTRLIKRYINKTTAPFIGLPEVVEELYETPSGRTLLKETHLTYDAYGNISSKTLYDSNREFLYTHRFTYNEKGQLIAETDPYGHTTTYEYDENGNCSKTVNSVGLVTKHTYDACNRLKSTTESDQETLYTYTQIPTSTSITSPLQTTATEFHNPTGTPYKTTNFLGHTSFTRHNELDHLISAKDPRGHLTTYERNIYGSPLLVTHPDGTTEEYTYRHDGKLLTYTSPSGLTTTHTYDEFGKIASTTYQSPEGEDLGTTHQLHNAFHLLEETNLEGYTTAYSYDGAGRLTQTQYEGKITTYLYDDLSRPTHEITGDTTTITNYDPLDRVTSTQIVSQDKLLHLTETSYDPLGNPLTRTTYPHNKPSTTTYTYDKLGRETSCTLPTGETTFTSYSQSYNATHIATTKPNGVTLVELRDSNDQLVSLETFSPSDLPLAKETHRYDPSGNRIQSTHYIYQDTELQNLFTIDLTYDSMGRKTSETECDSRTTSYTYTPTGNLATLTKPDDTLLTYTYDPLDNLSTLTSSDGTIDYHYTHNALGQLTDSTTTSRILDPHGNILTETLGNGYTFTSTYDSQGRRITLTLPNQKTILYTYLGPYLHTISFDDHTHTYTYDLAGNPLTETHIDGTETTYTYDKQSRPTSISSPTYSQIATYSPTGNITTLSTNHQTTTYIYDLLDQLIEEPLHTYRYDSLHNRTARDSHTYHLNHLNQYAHLDYTPSGNLARPHYRYDALDRLIQAGDTTYTYDTEHRRLAKNDTTYYWDGDHEIGTPTLYRILGNTPFAEIGATIAVCLPVPYPARHDLLGNLIEGGPYLQSFTAYGEGVHLLPWGYSSKRFDPETQLIYFGRRYYDPQLGRFLTPDPAGHTDTPNLYAYVRNNPLTNRDAHGLITTNWNSWFTEERRTWENPTFQDISFRQAAIGALHAPLQCAINTTLNLARYAGGLHGPDDFPLATLYDQATATHSAWQSNSARWLQSQLGADPKNPFYTHTYSTTYFASDLASTALLPLKIPSLPKAARLTKRASTIIPEARSALRTHRISQKLFQPNRSLPSPTKKPIWTSTRSRTSVENAYKHWKDHRYDFVNLKNTKQYVERTHQFTHSPPLGTLKKIRKNGDVILYHPPSNTFSITDKSGVPRTMYKPEIKRHPYANNLEYFNAQK